MSRLLTLANEVLYCIVHFIDHDDILNFAASCKALQVLAAAPAQRHRDLRDRYGNMKFGEMGRYSGQHPLFLLQQIIEDPGVAQYPTSLAIGEFTDWEELRPDSEEFVAAQEELRRSGIWDVADGFGEEIHALLSQCAHVDPEEVNSWHARITEEGHVGACFALLLTMLPNLRSIMVESNIDEFSEDFWPMVLRIASSHKDTDSAGPRCLSKLREVSFEPWAPKGESHRYQDAEMIADLAVLPSMRSLAASYLISGEAYDDAYIDWLDSPGTSQITNLHIHNSLIMDPSFPNLLSAFGNLQRFTYSCGGSFEDVYNYQPRKIVAALAKHAGHSLTSLYLTGYYIGNNRRGQDDERLDCDLRVFGKLQEIRLDYTLLQSSRPKSCTAICSQRGPHHTVHGVPRLVDVLPPSIEAVKLEGAMAEDQAHSFLSELAALKGERLPHLERVIMRSPIASSQVMIKTCKEVGVVLRKSGTAEEECEIKDMFY